MFGSIARTSANFCNPVELGGMARQKKAKARRSRPSEFAGSINICLYGGRFFIRDDGIHTTFRNNFGDLAFHLHLITSWVYADNFPPQAPFFSGIPLRYPYLADAYSALYWFATGGLKGAMVIPSMVMGWAFILLLYEFGRRLTLSRVAASLLPLIFLLGGSMGWCLWFKDLFSEGPGATEKLYSMIGIRGFQWPNMVDALWVPQRGLQWAFPLFLVLLSQGIAAAQTKDRKLFFLLSLIAAPLPFVHGHTLIALFMFALPLGVLFPSSAWIYLWYRSRFFGCPRFYFWGM